MATNTFIETLRNLEVDNKDLNIEYRRLIINNKSTDDLSDYINTLKNSNNIDNKIDALKNEIAITHSHSERKDIILQLQHTCTTETNLRSLIYNNSTFNNILFSIGFVVLSILCFLLGPYLLYLIANKINNDFFLLILHLLVYGVTFVPVYILAYFSPSRMQNIFMGIITMLENFLFIFFVNEAIHDNTLEYLFHQDKNVIFLIPLIIVTLIIIIPAIITGVIYFRLYIEWKH